MSDEGSSVDFCKAVILAMILVGINLGSVDAANFSNTRQGDDVTGAVGPATALCTSADPSSCSSQFNSGTSAHIGYHTYSSSSYPYAKYEIPLGARSACIDDGLSVTMRYQVNDVYHRDGFDDHDIFVKLRDYWTSSDYDLLDSTVDSSTSSSGGDYAYSGTLDFGVRSSSSGSNYYQWGHGTALVMDTTRTFAKNSISGTGQAGSYLEAYGTQNSKIGLKILTNPGNSAGDRETRIEVDWIRVQYENEDTAPTNPSGPNFYWEDSSMPGGPTASGWYNSLDSKVEVRFGSGGFDACEFEAIEYIWLPSTLQYPYSSSSGTTVRSDNSDNSQFSDVTVPSSSGSYRYWWRAVDGFGNRALWASSEAIDFDYTDPHLPLPTSDSTWHGATSSPSLHWSAASDTYSGLSGYSIQLDGVGPIGDITHIPGTDSYTYSIPLDSLSSGSNNFQITAKDMTEPAPNTHSRTVQIRYDPNPPVTNNPLVDNTTYRTQHPIIYWNSSIAFELEQESGLRECTFFVDASPVSTISVSECSSKTGMHPLPPLADGPHTLAIIACDLADNCNNGAPRSFIVDATPPALEEVMFIPSSTTWLNLRDLIVDARFSDQSAWGTGSGVDRVWHGFFPEGSSPTPAEVKEKHFSTCASACMSLEISHRETDLPSGSWIWHYIVKDEAGHERSGHASSVIRIDNTPPEFISGPFLNRTANDDLEASWSAIDLHSGISGYLFALDTCNFTNSSFTTSTSATFFDPSNGSHFVCVQALDFAGNYQTLKMDSEPPSLSCYAQSSEVGVDEVLLINNIEFVESPSELACILNDDSTINLRDKLGSIEMIKIDDSDLTANRSLVSHPGKFKVPIPPSKRGIGHHHLEVSALDQWGKAVYFEVTYLISGPGAILLLPNGTRVEPNQEFVMEFDWNQSDLDNLFRSYFHIHEVRADSLVESPLSEFFIVDIQPPNSAILVAKESWKPIPGSSETARFTIDDGYTSSNFTITLSVEACPSTHTLNNTSERCEQNPAYSALFGMSALMITLTALSALMITLMISRKRWEVSR